MKNSPDTTVMLQIRLFGGFDLAWQDIPLVPPPESAARSLFAYLITYRDRAHTRDLLAGTFWPDLPDSQARRRLSRTLSRLKRKLAPLLGAETFFLAEGGTLRFNEALPFWYDVAEFEGLVNPLLPGPGNEHQPAPPTGELASLQTLMAAAELYRGDFLAGYYDDWAVVERERLRELLLAALSCGLRLSKSQRAYDIALHFARRLAAEDPMREQAHQELMRLYFLLDRSQEALQQYRRCQEILTSELGVEPGSATTALCQEIAERSAQDSTPYLPPARQLMSSPLLDGSGQVPLVGRAGERAVLVDHLALAVNGMSGIVLVEGEPGVGKTRLLQEAMQDARWHDMRVMWGRGLELAERPPYGLIVEALRSGLSPLRTGQLAYLLERHKLEAVSLLLPELAQWLPDLPRRNVLASGPERSRLVEALADVALALGRIAPHLLILEDLHWADQATLEALEHLVHKLPSAEKETSGCRLLLIGSFRSSEAREQSAIWERLRGLASCDRCQWLVLEPLAADETRQLVQRALGLTTGAALFEARLHRETGGNPLFVLETLRNLLDEGLLRRAVNGQWRTPWDETTTDYAELPVPPTVQEVIVRRLSWLGQNARAVIEAAAVLGHDFDFPLLLSVCDLSQDQVLQAVDDLVRRRLLEEGTACYQFNHDLVRQVAYELLPPARRRRLHNRAGTALERWQASQIQALAYHFTEAGVWDKSMAYNCQAGDQARSVYAHRPAVDYYTRALSAWQACPGADPGLAIQLYQARGETRQDSGQFNLAEADLRAAYDLATQVGDGEAQARALNQLSYLYFQWGDLDLAIDVARQVLDLATRFGAGEDMQREIARAWLNKANATRNQGALQQAVALYEQAAAAFEQLHDQHHLADTLNRMGGALHHLGASADARAAIERSLAIRRQLDDRVGVSYSLINLSSFHLLRGHFDAAQQAAQEALRIANAVGDPYGADAALGNWGIALLEQGYVKRAVDLLEQALAIGRQIGDYPLQVDVLTHLGRAHHLLGQQPEARALLEEALGLLQKISPAWNLVELQVYLVPVLLAVGEVRQAVKQGRAALALAQQIDLPKPLGIAHRAMAEALMRTRDEVHRNEIIFHLTESIQVLRQHGLHGELGRSLAAYGHYLSRFEDAESRSRGAELLAEARSIFRRLGMAHDLAHLQGAACPVAQTRQVKVRLPAISAPPGRPLRDDEWVEVTWTVEVPADERLADQRTRRRQRLLQLCEQAAAQGAVPAQKDLATILGVSIATVKRDLAALRRAGHQIATRGRRQQNRHN